MILSLILAADEKGVIGKDGKLPWNLPNDLQYFREKTKGHPVIMGRKTFESIGRILPGRLNIVISSGVKEPMQKGQNLVFVPSLGDAIAEARKTHTDEAFVIGGSMVFHQSMNEANRIYFTQVHANVEGNTYFHPQKQKNFSEEWKEVSREDHPADAEHAYPYSFILFERR